MKKYQLDQEEQYILSAFENGDLQPIPHSKTEITRLTKIFKVAGNKKNRVSLRMTEHSQNDFIRAKETALQQEIFTMGRARHLFLTTALFSLIFGTIAQADTNIQEDSAALAKPTGNYGVGFQDFYWINDQVCPDPFYNSDTAKYFRADNPTHCHELMVRVYYPTDSKQAGAP